MMSNPQRIVSKIAFIADDFTVGYPTQQLLDRFTIGFPSKGAFRPPEVVVNAFVSTRNDDLNLRAKYLANGFGLNVNQSVAEVDGCIVIGKNELVLQTLKAIPDSTPLFVYGAGIADQELIKNRKVPYCSGTAAATLLRLPALKNPRRGAIRQLLIVVKGKFPNAELDALNAAFSFIDWHSGAAVKSGRFLEGKSVWDAGDRGEWPWKLLSAALSRSDKPQGNALVDGRTEDLVGLGLVRGMAVNPRAWQLTHKDGLVTTILVQDGVVDDMVAAMQTRAGEVLSTQLFQSPAPQQEHFNRLVSTLLSFFETKTPPWPREHSLQIGKLMELMAGQISLPPDQRGNSFAIYG